MKKNFSTQQVLVGIRKIKEVCSSRSCHCHHPPNHRHLSFFLKKNA